ncbi:hypothetical protein AAMO2058_000563500 [Amorphochlora amoebiformis]
MPAMTRDARVLVASLALLSGATAQLCQPVIGGQQYDFSSLEGPVYITVGPENPSGFKYVYQIQLCRDIAKPMISRCKGSSICQYMNSADQYLYLSSVSSWSQRPYPVWSFINSADTSEGVVLTSENGGSCGTSGFRRQMNFFFNCSTSSLPSIRVISDSTPNCPAPGLSCCYNFQITTPLACPEHSSGSSHSSSGGTIVQPGNPPPSYRYPGTGGGGQPTPPRSGGIPGSGPQPSWATPPTQDAPQAPAEEGLSNGWWFVISFTLVVGAYLVGGYVYNNRTGGLTGVDALPHKSFWMEVPGLVRDGCAVSSGFCGRMTRAIWPFNRLQYREVS